uniref:Putative LOC100197594 [Hydra vulgaris] n=1 Tax=Lepeophtheirus salmonis TaxID=72036 RepID=A0A0K2T221_LEPSM
MRHSGDEFNMDEITIRRAVHDDLDLNSFFRTPRHLLTVMMRALRLERRKKVLNYLKSHPSTLKIFTVDQVLNSRNVRSIAASPEEVQGTFRTKHPAKTMCSESWLLMGTTNTMRNFL